MFLSVMAGGLDADIYHCIKQERKAVEDKDQPIFILNTKNNFILKKTKIILQYSIN